MAHKEFMLKFKWGQEYLISVPKLRWKYQHLPERIEKGKEVDATLSAAEFVRRRRNPDNGHYSFFYNGKEIHNFTINSYQDPNLVILDIHEPLPGHPVPKREPENKVLPETELIPDQPSEEAEQVHQAKMRERDTRISADSNDLFVIASEVDLILRNYPARKALMVLDICKIIVTARY